MDVDRTKEFAATFERIQRPLRRPLADYRRRKVARADFAGYVFSRARNNAVAGFAHGFALRPGGLPGIVSPPEAVSYVFVRPVRSTLYDELVTRPRSPIRRLVAESVSLGYPFELHGGQETVAVRHRSLARVPRELFVLEACDFFMISQRPILTAGLVRRVAAATTSRGP